MKMLCNVMLAGVLSLVLSASAFAQDNGFANPFAPPGARGLLAPAASKALDGEGLRTVLVGLGYSPEKLDLSGGTSAYKVTLEHGGQSRMHVFGIDNVHKIVVICGGGFDYAPDAARGSNEWFRRLMKINNSLAPSYIFLNDNGVFGLTTVLGNSDLTASDIKQAIAKHLATFDNTLAPLVKELDQPLGIPAFPF